MLARLLGVLLTEPLTSSVGQGIPIVWLVKWEPRPDLLPTLHGFLDGRVWIGREVNIQIYIYIQRFCKRVYEKEIIGRFLNKGLYVYVYLYI